MAMKTVRRRSTQREAIEAVLTGSTRPLTPTEVLEQARAHCPGLGLATVYRNLAVLKEAGRIVPVHLPDEAPRYERAGLDHHHHFVCTQCGSVTELPGCALRSGKHAPRGYRVERHEITLYGQCRSCNV